MRRLLAASLVPVLVACKKEPPPPTTGAVTTAASIAATPSAAPRPAATPLPEGATISLRYTGTFKVIESSGAIILDAGEVFYTLDDDGPRQLKDLRRGTRSERQNSAFSGRPGECFFVNRWDQSAETGHQRVNQPMKRTGDFWAAVELGSSDDPTVFVSDVLPWKDGRHLAVLQSANRPGSLSLYQACGKGAGSVPSFSPFPKSTPAIDSGAPGEKAPPTPKGSAAPSASSSPSTSASAGAAPTPPAPTEPPAKEPEPDRCPQRLTWASDESPSGRLAIAPAGEVFVVGRDCAAPEKEISSSIVVERWDANGKKLGIEKLPTKAMPSHLLAAAKDNVFALGGDQKRGQVVRFDGTSWTTEETPIEARITRGAVDASGALWLLAGGQVWRRSPSGAYQRATLPEGTGEVKAIAATGQRVWLALQNKLLSSGPAAAPVAIEAVEITKYKGSDYTDYAAGPFCGTPYVKVGLVKQAGADVDKAFPDLRAQLKSAGQGKVEAVWEDRGGQQWLGLRMPSSESARKLVEVIKAADPKSAALAICNDPRGNFVKKTASIE